MIYGKDLVHARRKKGELETTGRIGGLQSGSRGSMLRNCQDGSAQRPIVQGDGPAEGSHIISEGDLAGLRRAAGRNRQGGLQQMCRAKHSGLHIQATVGIDLDTICSGSDMLQLRRSSTSLSD